VGVLARVARCSRACRGCPCAVVAKLTDLASTMGPRRAAGSPRATAPAWFADLTPASRWLGADRRTCSVADSTPASRWLGTDRTPASRWLGAGRRTCSVADSNPGEPLARRGPPHLLGCGPNSAPSRWLGAGRRTCLVADSTLYRAAGSAQAAPARLRTRLVSLRA